MVTRGARYRSATTLFLLARAMRAAARWLFAAATNLQVRLERRKVAAAAYSDFCRMSERELLDIGIAHADLHRVAWGASDQYQRQTSVLRGSAS